MDPAGTDALTLSGCTLTASGPDGGYGAAPPSRHRLLRRRRATACGTSPTSRCTTTGSSTRGRPARLRPAAGQRPRPHVRRRPDRPAVARASADPAPASSPTSVSRALAVATAYDMLVKGELGRGDADLRAWRARDRAPGRRRRAVPAGWRAGSPADFTPVDLIDGQRQPGRRRGGRTRQGAGARQGCPLELAANAVTTEHFAQVDEAAADDLGLAWRIAATRAARGDYDEDAVERLLERDPDPDAPSAPWPCVRPARSRRPRRRPGTRCTSSSPCRPAGHAG